MASTYRYWEAADGRRFCYARDATYRCPVSSMTELDDGLRAAADALGVHPGKLVRLLAAPHPHGARRERVDGQLTETCAHCGHRLQRDGFRVWVERPATEEEVRENAGLAISSRLGYGARVTERVSWCDTKKEARTWAYDGYRQAQAALAEGVR